MALLLVDTNFFLDCLRLGIPLDEVEKFGEVFMPQNVLREMESLALEGKENNYRRVACEWAKKYRVYPSEGDVDESFLGLARKGKIIVATNDSRLKKSLKRLGADVVFIRSRSHLELI